MSSAAVAKVQQLVRESHFTEGEALRNYVDRFTFSESILNRQWGDSSRLSPWMRATVLAYLTAKTLDQDNCRTGAGVPPWADGSSPLRPSIQWLIDAILKATVAAGTPPAVITKIDIWTCRTQQQNTAVLSQDIESFYRWNIVVLDRIRTLVRDGSAAGADPAHVSQVVSSLDQATSKAVALLEEAPSAKLSEFVWSCCSKVVPQGDPALAAAIHSFVGASLCFQELSTEISKLEIAKTDVYLARELDEVGLAFNHAAGALPSGVRYAFADACMKALGAWEKTFTMLYSATAVPKGLQLIKIVRILKRIAAKLTAMQHSQLRDACLKLSASIASRGPQEPPSLVTPFPQISRDEEMQTNVLVDIGASMFGR